MLDGCVRVLAPHTTPNNRKLMIFSQQKNVHSIQTNQNTPRELTHVR